MSESPKIQVTRRTAVLGGALAAAGIAAGTKMVAASPSLQSVQSGGGVSGGGTIKAEDQTATFSFFASRFTVENQTDPVVLGRVQWADDSGFGFESTTIISYGPIEDDETAREIKGTAKLATGEEVPFTLFVRDIEGPGTGKDDLKLTTESADGTEYVVEGVIATGDVQLLVFEFPE